MFCIFTATSNILPPPPLPAFVYSSCACVCVGMDVTVPAVIGCSGDVGAPSWWRCCVDGLSRGTKTTRRRVCLMAAVVSSGQQLPVSRCPPSCLSFVAAGLAGVSVLYILVHTDGIKNFSADNLRGCHQVFLLFSHELSSFLCRSVHCEASRRTAGNN